MILIKALRLRELVDSTDTNFESIQDTFLDVFNYAIIGQALQEKVWFSKEDIQEVLEEMNLYGLENNQIEESIRETIG